MAEETKNSSTETEDAVLGMVESKADLFENIKTVYNGVPHLTEGSTFINKFTVIF